MNSLREEIKDILISHHQYGELETSFEELTDEILSMIEKRINELLPDDEGDYQLITKGRIKEEMLK